MEGAKIREKQRLDYIDMLKGIGIILVVMGHHLLELDGLGIWIYSFHMPLFFIITGYLSEHKKEKCEDIKRVVINKAKSLMYPYFTFSLINIIWYVVFYIITPIGGQPGETLKVVLLKTLTTFGYHAMWFLPAFFVGTVLFTVINKTKFSHIIHIIVLIAGCAVCIWIRHTEMERNVVWYVLNYISRTAVATSFIYIGSLICRFLNKLNNLTEWICIAVCAVIVVITLIINLTYMNEYNLAISEIGNPLLFYISSISNSILLLLICKKINLKKGLLNFYGKNSLVIMALHMGFPVEIAWLIVGITKCPFSALVNSIIVIIIEFIIMTVCILLINKYFKFIMRLPSKSKKNIDNKKSS
ncbi:MAG: acyltransferase family protein [Acutalibacteraceae bacterium]|nr:acyltransferase family protein [Acutalibacteraceae bacterium]